MPTVINAYHYAPLLPNGPPLPSGAAYIGQAHTKLYLASALANPYPHGAKSLELYRRHIHNLIRNEDAFAMAELEAISENTALVCLCKSQDGSGDCHGDIVIAAWRHLQSKRQGQQPAAETVTLARLEREHELRLERRVIETLERVRRAPIESEPEPTYLQQPLDGAAIDADLAAEAQLEQIRARDEERQRYPPIDSTKGREFDEAARNGLLQWKNLLKEKRKQIKCG